MVKNSQNFFDGEKYISSKQAAELANYTSDYIGQLCRGGKIKARRIGRDWFVSEENLLEYQDKLAGITREVSIKINHEPLRPDVGVSRNDFQQEKEQTNYGPQTNDYGPRTIDYGLETDSRISRLPAIARSDSDLQAGQSEINDIYSFDISGEKIKNEHLRELFKDKNYGLKTNDYGLRIDSRISRENEPLRPDVGASRNKTKKINIFSSAWKTLAGVSAFSLITIVKINHALANWIEDRRYEKIKKQELKTKNYGFKSISRKSRLPAIARSDSDLQAGLPAVAPVLVSIGVIATIFGAILYNPALFFENAEKLVQNAPIVARQATLYIAEIPAKGIEMGVRGIKGITNGVNGIAKVIDYSLAKHKVQISQNKTQDTKPRTQELSQYFAKLQNVEKERNVVEKIETGEKEKIQNSKLSQLLKSQFIDIPFSAKDLKEAFLEIPKTLFFARDSIRLTFGMIGEEAKLLSQKIFFGAKTFVQDFIKRKPLAQKKEESSKTVVVEYSPKPVLPENDSSRKNFQLASQDIEDSSIIKKILGRLSLVESRAGIGQISAQDLATINANIRADTKILIDQAIVGIEKRIPPVSQNPVVFLTSGVPGPTRNDPPQQGSGVTAAFGEFSQSLGTGGSFKASGNVTLGSETSDVSVLSDTWRITVAGVVTGFTSIDAESLTLSDGMTVSGGLTLSGGQTISGTAIFNNSVGIGTSTPGSIFSIDQVGNLVANASSTIYHGFAFPGLSATSTGITVSGGNFLQTNTATNTFAGGLAVSGGGLVSSNGLTISGGDIIHSGATFRLTSGGDLGIGTTSPWASFALEHNGSVENLFVISDQGTSTPTLIVKGSGNIGIGTSSPMANIEILQKANGVPILSAYRVTDTSPSGDFINYKTKGGTTLFRVDNSGNLLAGGIVNSGSETITSVSSPQLRVQYDATNEVTTSVTSAGVTTYGFNGTTPTGIWTPQSNSTNTFSFTDSSSNSILSIDTTNRRVGIGTTTPGSILSIQGVGNFITHGTSTLYNPLQVAGINATSSGITISGGTLINTSTATSTFSGGISATSVGGLSSASGLTLTGGDLNSNGIYRFTGTATSTLLGGLSTVGLSSSAGLTISGGNILNTSTASSSFSGGIGATSLSASGGLTISGGAILQTGGATSTLLGLTSSGLTSSAGLNITGGSISTNGLIYNTNTGTSTFDGGITTTGLSSSAGLSITGGSILNTGTATSTFSGGISATSLAASAGLTLSGGDLIHTGATFRLTSGGNVGIGTTNPLQALHVAGTMGLSSSLASSGPSSDTLCVDTSTFEVFRISGACTGSSIQYKQDIQTYNNALDTIL